MSQSIFVRIHFLILFVHEKFKNKCWSLESLVVVLFVELTNIVAGLILAMGILSSIPAIGDDLVKLAKWLGRFQTLIGVVAIVIGILNFGVQGIVAIIAGLVLAMGILPSIPAIGDDLERLAKWLGRSQTVIGVIAILVGIWGLL